MKKLLSTILCLAMMLSLATPALAASSTTASGIRGEIIYQEGSNSLSRSSPTVIVSSVKNQDGSYTICQYMGRWMMYNVFGIDEAPTSWTNLD